MSDLPEPMNEIQFWEVVGRAGGDADRLKHLLMRLPREEIVAFDLRLDEIMYQLDRSEIQDVTGGSDDGFEYVRLWIVSRGREYVERVLRNPENAPHFPEQEENEQFGYAAMEAYEEKFSERMPNDRWKRRSGSNTQGWT
jgi:hypothetical protein